MRCQAHPWAAALGYLTPDPAGIQTLSAAPALPRPARRTGEGWRPIGLPDAAQSWPRPRIRGLPLGRRASVVPGASCPASMNP